MRDAASLLAFVLIYLGAANAALAILVGTCTGDSANSLMGGLFSTALYALALVLFGVGRPGRAAYGWLAPVAPVLGWQSWFSIKLFVGFNFLGMSACDVKMGEPYGMDGRELLLSLLWLGTHLAVLCGLAIAYRRGARLSEA